MSKLFGSITALLIMSLPVWGAQEYKNVTIKDVIVNMETGVHFRINESMDYNEDCGSTNWFKVESETTYQKEALSLLLSFQAQGKSITAYMKGCTGGYPRLYYLY